MAAPRHRYVRPVVARRCDDPARDGDQRPPLHHRGAAPHRVPGEAVRVHPFARGRADVDGGGYPRLVSQAEIMSFTYEELWGRAEQLLPKLRERAARCEELRRLPDETLRDFHDTGLF